MKPSSKFLSQNNHNKKYIIFLLGKEIYALDILYVKEIHDINTIMIPRENEDAPSYLLGTAYLYGEVISLIDINVFFHMPPSVNKERRLTIILKKNNKLLGLVTQATLDMIEITSDQLKPVSNALHRDYLENIAVLKDCYINILDVQKLIEGNEAFNIKLAQ